MFHPYQGQFDILMDEKALINFPVVASNYFISDFMPSYLAPTSKLLNTISLLDAFIYV